MKDGALHQAMRELRAHLARPLTPVVLLAVAIVLGLSGPFGTYGAMGLPARLGYWLLIVAGTYSAGYLTSAMLRQLLPPLPALVRAPLAALAVTLPVAGITTALALLTGRALPDGAPDWLQSLGGLFLICLAFEAVAEVADRHTLPAAPAPPVPPAILARLPLHLRGELLALSSADHYVTVTTTRGREMLLMRLSDAIAETAPTPGLQVHRSHWVARAAIARVTRRGDGAVVTLQGGAEVPVSRGFLPAVQALGLLPGKPRP